MKVWARYAIPVMVLVDEDQDEIERVVMIPGERFIDRETMGDMPAQVLRSAPRRRVLDSATAICGLSPGVAPSLLKTIALTFVL